jgi:hypothetical protein
MRLHIVRAQRGQSDDPVGQLHFMHSAILDAGAVSHRPIPPDTRRPASRRCWGIPGRASLSGPQVVIRGVHELHLRPAQCRRVGYLASGRLSKARRVTICSAPQGLAPGRQVDSRLRKPQVIDELVEHGIHCGPTILQLRTVRGRLLYLKLPGARSRHQVLAEQ